MRLFAALGLAATLAGCATGQPTGPSALERLGERWKACITPSFNDAVRKGAERNYAAETAFMACKSEEDAMIAVYSDDFESLLRNQRRMSALRAGVKARLVSGDWR